MTIHARRDTCPCCCNQEELLRGLHLVGVAIVMAASVLQSLLVHWCPRLKQRRRRGGVAAAGGGNCSRCRGASSNQ